MVEQSQAQLLNHATHKDAQDVSHHEFSFFFCGIYFARFQRKGLLFVQKHFIS